MYLKQNAYEDVTCVRTGDALCVFRWEQIGNIFLSDKQGKDNNLYRCLGTLMGLQPVLVYFLLYLIFENQVFSCSKTRL